MKLYHTHGEDNKIIFYNSRNKSKKKKHFPKSKINFPSCFRHRIKSSILRNVAPNLKFSIIDRSRRDTWNLFSLDPGIYQSISEHEGIECNFASGSKNPRTTLVEDERKRERRRLRRMIFMLTMTHRLCIRAGPSTLEAGRVTTLMTTLLPPVHAGLRSS